MAAAEENSFCIGDATKKNSMKLRSPTITMYTEPHIMPTPSRIPWSSREMTWTTQPNTYDRVVEFNAEVPHCSKIDYFNKKRLFKRKASLDVEVPSKQHITEEKMAEHLSSLHISSDYTSHQKISDESMSMESDHQWTQTSKQYNISMSQQDLEQKLKNAQRITVCEQIRQLSTEPILPRALIERMERPCTALVLWQPPPRITDLIIPRRNSNKQETEDQDNNNSMSIDMNLNNGNSMDLDL